MRTIASIMNPKTDNQTSPNSSWRHIWHLSWPIMISNLSQPLVGATDTAMMGHLPDPAYIGGVALGSLVIHFVVMLFSFLRMSTTGLTSQAHGAGHHLQRLLPLQRGLLIGLSAGLLFVIGQIFLIEGALILLPASDAVEHHMADYISVHIFAMPAILMNTAMLGWLYGLQSMRIGMIQLLIINGLNILLNFVFVLGFDGGIKGVALASVIANWSGFLFVLVIIARQFKAELFGFFNLQQALFSTGWSAYFSLSRDILIRTLLLYLVEAILLSIGGKQGDLELAALQLIIVIFGLIAYSLDGFAHASEALVGAAIGAKQKEKLRQIIWRATSLAALVSGLMALSLWIGAPYLLSLLTSHESVKEITLDLWIYVMALGPASVLAFQMDGIFIGAAFGRALRNGMVISFTLFLVSLYLFKDAALDGVMIAFILYLGARGLSLAWRLPQLYALTNTPSN